MGNQRFFDLAHKEHDDGVHVVHLKGHFDSVSSPIVESKMIEIIEKADKIVVNFSETIYISSAGLRVILVATKKSRKKNAKIIFCSVGESVRKILEISNFLSFMEIAGSMEEAMGTIKNHGK